MSTPPLAPRRRAMLGDNLTLSESRPRANSAVSAASARSGVSARGGPRSARGPMTARSNVSASSRKHAVKEFKAAEDETAVMPEKALFCLASTNPLRIVCWKTIQQKWFEVFILVCILINCVSLALADPFESPNSTKSKILATAEFVFTIVFTLEMLIKVIGMGFVGHKGAYLRNLWNILDFVVVVMSWAQYLPGVDSVSAVRAFRVLRTIKAIRGIESLRAIVETLLSSLPSLLTVQMLAAFFIFLFAIIALQLYMGVLHNRCVAPDGTFDNSEDNMCREETNCAAQTGIPGAMCLPKGTNPDMGFSGFDHLPLGFLTTTALLSLDEWEDVQFYIVRCTSQWQYFFFVVLVLMGSFFVVNLMLAVVAVSYADAVAGDGKDDPLRFVEEEGAKAFLLNHAFFAGDALYEQDPMLLIGEMSDDDEMSDDAEAVDTSFVIARHTNKLVNSTKFQLFILGMILLNTLTLALEHPGMPQTLADILTISNFVFVTVFFVEMVLKLVGLGVRGYIRDRMNIFDGVLVIISIFELIFDNFAWVRALRLLRVFRVLKLARSWGSLRIIIQTIGSSIQSVGNITLIILIHVMVFSLMGQQLYGGKYELFNEAPYEGKPRFNFDDFYWAFVTIFRVLIGEWVVSMRWAVIATNPSAILFFIIALVTGTFLVLNLFLAILLSNFDEIHVDDHKSFDRSFCAGWCCCTQSAHYTVDDMDAEEVPSPRKKDDGMGEITINAPSEEEWQEEEEEEIRWSDFTSSHSYTSLFIFRPTHPVRVALQLVVEHKAFENVILFLIIISSLALALETPGADPNSDFARALSVINIVFGALFTMELLMKVIAWGLFVHPGSYMRNFWNVLDFVVVCFSLLALAVTGSRVLVGFRALRALRPLRAIKRNEGLRIVVHSLVRSVPAILNVTLVCFLFWFIFGIMGVQLFGRKFWRCTDESIEYEVDCIGEDANGVPRSWFNAPSHFDNIFAAYFTMLRVATFDDWELVLLDGIDSTEIGRAPKTDNNKLAAFYFFVFIVVGSFFALNLFIGVVIDNFNQLKKRLGDHALLSDFQVEWREALMESMKRKPQAKVQRPKQCFRALLFDVVKHPAFSIVMMAATALNTIVLAMPYWGMSEGYKNGLVYSNLVFTIIFIVEAAMKITAMDKHYFKEWWNVFDFALVVISVATFTVERAGSWSPNTNFLRALKVFRVTRVIRLIKDAKRLQHLFVVLLYSGPSLLNIGALLFLLYFVFAILGMSLFGQVRLGGVMSEDFNFRSFGNAMALLFTISTGAKWSAVMAQCSIEAPACDPALGDCGNPYAAMFYFSSFMIGGNFVMVNLYIAVILESFSKAHEDSNQRITQDDYESFERAWSELDPRAKQVIAHNEVPTLLRSLRPPLGYKGTDEAGVSNLVGHLCINIVCGRTLAVGDQATNSSDPYILLKCGDHQFQTPVIMSTLNPVWRGQTIVFPIHDKGTVVKVTACDWNRFGSNDVLGEAEVKLQAFREGHNKIVLKAPSTASKIVQRVEAKQKPDFQPNAVQDQGYGVVHAVCSFVPHHPPDLADVVRRLNLPHSNGLCTFPDVLSALVQAVFGDVDVPDVVRNRMSERHQRRRSVVTSTSEINHLPPPRPSIAFASVKSGGMWSTASSDLPSTLSSLHEESLEEESSEEVFPVGAGLHSAAGADAGAAAAGIVIDETSDEALKERGGRSRFLSLQEGDFDPSKLRPLRRAHTAEDLDQKRRAITWTEQDVASPSKFEESVLFVPPDILPPLTSSRQSTGDSEAEDVEDAGALGNLSPMQLSHSGDIFAMSATPNVVNDDDDDTS